MFGSIVASIILLVMEPSQIPYQKESARSEGSNGKWVEQTESNTFVPLLITTQGATL
jgi:hypothetical protein